MSLSDGTLVSKLPDEIRSSYQIQIDHKLKPMSGNWNNQEDIYCDAIGMYGYSFIEGPGREDVLLDVIIEPSEKTESVGIIIEPSGEDQLESGYSLSIEPMKERVIFDRWPASMDPLWDSLVLNERHNIEVTREIDSPLVERPLAFVPKDNQYRIKIIYNGSAIECFVADQVVASYRIYENSKTHVWGLFVQEGSANFRNLNFYK